MAMENMSNATIRVFLILIVLLLVAVAAQSYFMFKVIRDRGPAPPTEQPTAEAPLSPAVPGDAITPGVPGVPDDLFAAPGSGAWDPFVEMQRMREQMDRLFDESFGRFRADPGFAAPSGLPAFAPRLDLREETDRYVVHLDLPGTEKENISVRLDDRLLTVEGAISEVVEEQDGRRMLRSERRTGRFSRSITLPGPVTTEGMQADYEDGVLTVTIPKGAASGASRKITI